MNLNKKIILSSITFFLLGLLVSVTFNKPQVKTTSLNKSPEVSREIKPLGFMSAVTFKGQDLLYRINDHGIYFYPVENSQPSGFVDIIIEKEKYPDLFNQGIANSSVLQIFEYKDTSSAKNLLKITNSQPDHGGFASTFVLLIDPVTGEINEAENDYQLEAK